ncbi:chromate resistance protein ChrB domain-containing protein [Methylorubrum extorquens]|jgi:rhodanese-related sulfurtransferase|uniref:Rhodanese domain protein n=2 Tax=Methylorubrum extorquens TaxID=408 RepID=B7KQW8_METC4|nr:sulfurtransferase/chromate resistance protein [Methylorubrum extorquens]ACK85509.1 Rhodanese domain protein [Methylorubrum extorquens CM4]WHQ69511.1 chromate resistance protein [Methylorubrum extorquens]
MPVPNTITVEKLARLIGTPACPVVVDVRTYKEFLADQRHVPGSLVRAPDRVAEWAPGLRGRSVVVVCEDGRRSSHGVAAWLRSAGVEAEALQGGIADWAAAELPMVPAGKIRNRDEQGRTVWVTRARPKVDRIACPWLIRRFVDPDAVFLFVPPSEVAGVADHFEAAPFDIDDPGTFWSHRGELCTFDVMVEELGLATPPLLHLATLVRGADTGKPDLAPEAAGLLAASLGLSRIYADDLAQLDAGMLLYDAFYRWCRDATEERHTWEGDRTKGKA